MSNVTVEKTKKGFNVKKSEKLLEKEAREQRKLERKEILKTNKNKSVTNEELYQLLLDIQADVDELKEKCIE